MLEESTGLLQPSSVEEILARPFATLPELIRAHARERSEHCALREGDRSLSYAQLDRLMDRIAVALQRDAVRVGESVAICATTSLEYAATFLGILRAGAVVVPLVPASTAETLAMMLRDCAARVLFRDRPVAQALAALPLETRCVSLDGKAAGTPFASWLAPDGAAPQPITALPEQAFNILYSSGTTGVPKGIGQPNSMRWLQMAKGVYPAEAVTLISTSLYSNTTLVSFLPTLSNGGTVILLPKFEVQDFLRLSEEFRVTHTMLVPIQYRRLLQSADFGRYDLSNYQTKYATSAPFAAELKAETLRRWPGGLVEYYGMTEGGGSCMLSAHEFPHKLHTVGQPLDGHDIRIIDDAGREVMRGGIGEIVGRSGAMMLGYHNQPMKTRDGEWTSPQGERFIRSGDAGRFDEDGFLTLLDRKKDLIISGGMNLYPSDLEAQILQHPDVLEAAVVGVPSERWGESPAAFVVLKPSGSVTAPSLLEWANQRLSKLQRLIDLQVLQELPRSHIGKVNKRELRARVGAGATS